MFRTIFALLLLASAPVRGSGVPDETLLQRLRGGEVDLVYTHTEEAGAAAKVKVLMDTPVERIWNALLSCEEAFVYVKNMTACKVLEWKENQSRVNQVVQRPWPLPLLDYVFESDYTPYSGIEFRLVEGNLDILEGSWAFQETDDGLLVAHELRVKPAFFVPRFLVRRVIGKQLPDLVACLRGIASGSLTPAQRNEDIARCPNPPAPD